jgi:hypothetical protein
MTRTDPLADQPGTVYVLGTRSAINDRIMRDMAFGWQADDPVRRINLRSLDHGQVVARYTKRDASGKPVVQSYLRYDAAAKRV